MSRDFDSMSLRGRLVVGGLFAGVGLFVMVLSATRPDSVNGPWWLGFAAGGVFAAAGLSIGTHGTPVGRYMAPAAVFAILAGFAAIGNWIAFGPGPRACSGGVSVLFLQSSRAAADLECRIGFGVGALILDACIFMAATSALAKRLSHRVWSPRLERLGTGVLLVSLLPLLVVAGVLALLGAGGKAIAAGVRSRVGGRRPGA